MHTAAAQFKVGRRAEGPNLPAARHHGKGRDAAAEPAWIAHHRPARHSHSSSCWLWLVSPAPRMLAQAPFCAVPPAVSFTSDLHLYPLAAECRVIAVACECQQPIRKEPNSLLCVTYASNFFQRPTRADVRRQLSSPMKFSTFPSTLRRPLLPPASSLELFICGLRVAQLKAEESSYLTNP